MSVSHCTIGEKKRQPPLDENFSAQNDEADFKPALSPVRRNCQLRFFEEENDCDDEQPPALEPMRGSTAPSAGEVRRMIETIYLKLAPDHGTYCALFWKLQLRHPFCVDS